VVGEPGGAEAEVRRHWAWWCGHGEM
jgi:hypothetical protein